MVLCQYFMNGSCRFGSKCHNEHLDVKGVIKQEMEAAIKGRQWPLSVFGPFKEKTNLIPDEYDLSFEECRLQFLESQATNSFPMYQQQLMTKIQEANGRLQNLMNCTKEVVQMAVNIYNNNNKDLNTQQQGGGNQMATNAAGIFGGTTTNTFGGANTNAASIFGGGNKFGATQNAASIFGGSQSTFGGTQNNAASIFGGAQTQSQGFGMSTGQTNSIFGGATQTNAQANTGLFGQALSTQQSGASLFGGTQQSQGTGSLFGQTNTFGSAVSSNQGLFSKVNTPAFGSSAFGSTTIQPTGLFGSNTVQQTPGFGSQVPQQQTQGLFGQQQQPPPQQQSAFGSFANPTPNPSPFGMQQQQQQPQQAAVPPSTNIFGNLGQQAAQQALASFTSQMTQQPTSTPFGGLTTNQGANPPTMFSQQQPQAPSMNASLYSKMEDLSQEHLAAFQADEFIIGQIPNVPPPKELC